MLVDSKQASEAKVLKTRSSQIRGSAGGRGIERERKRGETARMWLRRAQYGATTAERAENIRIREPGSSSTAALAARNDATLLICGIRSQYPLNRTGIYVADLYSVQWADEA